jgi:hypothetical protein
MAQILPGFQTPGCGNTVANETIQFEMPVVADVPDMGVLTSNIYPSPTNSTRESASPQPTIKVEEERLEHGEDAKPAAKSPAKRKRENRYKNAPPSVLSVGHPNCIAVKLSTNLWHSGGEHKIAPRKGHTGNERTSASRISRPCSRSPSKRAMP